MLAGPLTGSGLFGPIRFVASLGGARLSLSVNHRRDRASCLISVFALNGIEPAARAHMYLLNETDVQKLVSVRHELHAHPEISREEVWTAGFILERLNELGIKARAGIGGHGVVGVIEGSRPGPGIALRADMDALEIQEQSDAHYASQIPGKMHACGHDGHVAILLGAATILARSADFSGTVYLVFQPAEETFGGAQLMFTDGLLERFPFQQVFGVHNWPNMPVGTVAVHDGPVMAGTAEFELTFSANGSHAAMPHLTGEPLLAGGHFITGLQQAVGRAVAEDTGLDIFTRPGWQASEPSIF